MKKPVTTKDIAHMVNKDLKSLHIAINQFLKRKNITSKSTSEVDFLTFNKDAINYQYPKHWEYVDRGRKPGSYPPKLAIIEWLKEKKIPTPKGMTREQFAYLICRAIYSKGIVPRPFLAELQDIVADFILSQYTSFINKMLK